MYFVHENRVYNVMQQAKSFCLEKSKRKGNVYEQKSNEKENCILDELVAGASQGQVAKKYGLGRSTFKRWLVKGDKIRTIDTCILGGDFGAIFGRVPTLQTTLQAETMHLLAASLEVLLDYCRDEVADEDFTTWSRFGGTSQL